MLDLLMGHAPNCEGISRRSLLRIGALSGFGLSLPLLLKARSAQAAIAQPKTARLAAAKAAASKKDVNCILIWTWGGTSHHDTLDPKPNAPLSIRGEYSAIDTAVPGVQFTEICPHMAAELKRFAVLRGWNPKNGSHGMADAWVMSGRQFNPGVTYPCYGSVVSHQKGFRSAAAVRAARQ